MTTVSPPPRAHRRAVPRGTVVVRAPQVGVRAALVTALLALLLPLLAAPPAAATPDVLDCTGPAPDAEPGTPEWDARDLANILCGEQRLVDAVAHPTLATPVTMPVGDPYRDPTRHDGSRFRFLETTVANERGDELPVEVYVPCAAGTCDLAEGLQTFEPPYPAVLVQHGGYQARKELHWWATQSLAEAGYMTVSLSAPHDDDMFFEDSSAVLDWFTATPETPVADGSFNPFWAELDPDRIGMAGHSGGGATANRHGHGDERIKAVVGWDRSGRYDLPDSLTVPSLYLLADHGFTPERREDPPPPDGYEGEPRPGDKWADFDQVRDAHVDTMKIALRAATHLDWVPMAVAASRHGEVVSTYYTLAWFDRYLKGLDDPEIARDAFERLTATTFDGSADRHNISQGVWDPALAVTSGDPLYGGNVPYALDGMSVADRLSFYFDSKCDIGAPDGTGRFVSDDLRTSACDRAPAAGPPPAGEATPERDDARRTPGDVDAPAPREDEAVPMSSRQLPATGTPGTGFLGAAAIAVAVRLRGRSR